MWSILALLPWGSIIAGIAQILSILYGKSLLGWIFELIAAKAPLIDKGLMTGAQATAMNVGAIQQATQASPGLDESTASFIHKVAYLEWVRIHKPDKFKKWVKNIAAWHKKADRIPSSYFHRFEDESMKLYRGDSNGQ